VNDRLKTARLVAVGLLGLALFNFPLLAVFDTDAVVAGMPALWAYLFVAWALVIALLAWLARSR
jgi:hypothetical protein